MRTFVCWWWKGWRPIYTSEHVYQLQRMIARHYKAPHRFLCITDQPQKLRCDTFPIWPVDNGVRTVRKGQPSCYMRLRLFHEWAKQFGDQLVSIDLDSIILDDITNLFTDEPFKILKGGAAPYNGSLWQVTPGVYNHVWDDFSPDTVKIAGNNRHKHNNRKWYGSDQVYMSYAVPDAPLWGPQDGVYQYGWLKQGVPDDAKIIFFAGSKKPWDSPLVREYWTAGGV